MQLEQIFKDKTLKPKEKTEHLSQLVSDNTISVKELIAFANAAKDPVKATCIECLEFATQANPGILNDEGLAWIISNLGSKAPRVKWECAKVISNTIHLYPPKVNAAVTKLLDNTATAEGTVVRWSAATALAAVLKMKTKMNEELIPAIENIMANEEKNSIKKIYAAALKKIKP